jgi:hypothetical protein
MVLLNSKPYILLNITANILSHVSAKVAYNCSCAKWQVPVEYGEEIPVQQEVCPMIRNLTREQLTRLPAKTLAQVFVMQVKVGLVTATTLRPITQEPANLQA